MKRTSEEVVVIDDNEMPAKTAKTQEERVDPDEILIESKVPAEYLRRTLVNWAMRWVRQRMPKAEQREDAVELCHTLAAEFLVKTPNKDIRRFTVDKLYKEFCAFSYTWMDDDM